MVQVDVRFHSLPCVLTLTIRKGMDMEPATQLNPHFSQEEAIANTVAQWGAFQERGIHLVAAISVARIRTYYLTNEDESGEKGVSVAETDKLIEKALKQHGAKKSKVYFVLGLAKKWCSALAKAGRDKSPAIQAVLTAAPVTQDDDGVLLTASAVATNSLVALAKADGITTLDILARRMASKPKEKPGSNSEVRPTTASPQAIAAKLEQELPDAKGQTYATVIGAKPFVSNYKRGAGDMVALILEALANVTSLDDCTRINKALAARVNELTTRKALPAPVVEQAGAAMAG